jgi:hypothetical protein
MKTRRLTTILTSAYVSAMLASSVAPIRSDATLAATIDPMAAQKALQNAVSGLDAVGWAAAVAGTSVPVPPAPKNVPADPTPKADHVMTEELMARLIKFTRTKGKHALMDYHISGAFGINDGTTDVPILQVAEPLPEGKHYLMLPTQEGSRDIVFAFKPAGGGEIPVYQTDKFGTLRAAGILSTTGVRLITNEQAAEKFKAEMQLFAKLAKDLPPTGAPAPGNS